MGGGNSRMMLENYQSTEMNTNISTYTDLVKWDFVLQK